MEKKKKTPRPQRVSKRNRKFFDSNIWDNHNKTTETLTSPTPIAASTPLASSPISGSPPDPAPTRQAHTSGGRMLKNVEPPRVHPQGDTKEKIVRHGLKRKNFVRFRFQIDCTSAAEVNVDELVNFLKTNMKVDGKKNNLADVTINRKNSNINIMSKVIIKKKYLKRLSKCYLKKKKQNYRVLEKNNRAYKITLKV